MSSTSSQVVRADKIWLDGKFVKWDEGQIPVMTHALHYGLGVFEGIRAYRTKDGRLAIFRLREHIQRLYDSAHICMMKLPFTLDQFTEEPLVQRELAKKGVKDFELKMRTKAEEDPVVADASVVARAEFQRQMGSLSKKLGERLQKGAGPLVKEQATRIMEMLGGRALGEFAKLHFRTAYEVVSAAGKLA